MHQDSYKVGIGIPTLNRYDLLSKNLLLYAKDFRLDRNTTFIILDNGKQGINFTYGKVVEKEKNIGVGASWNQLCQRIFENCDYALILNDDIYFGKRISEVNSIISKKPDKFQRATPDWCAFLLPKKVYEEVGPFDECFFPAYYEDKSYEYRMKLKNIPVIKNPNLNPYEYRNSQSLEKDLTILEASKKNKKIYIQMWGGEPERETYKKPYNK
jgi:GT2 family glycosyltransferase